MQEVYQKQVDEVVKAKLQEFQTQLDTAQSEFLEELRMAELKQQVIAESAARKIKDVIDKLVHTISYILKSMRIFRNIEKILLSDTVWR